MPSIRLPSPVKFPKDEARIVFPLPKFHTPGFTFFKEEVQAGPECFDFEVPPEWFHEGQLAAWAAEEEVILLLCGRQSGKTTFGAWWLAREIQRMGPGDYGFNGPTLELLKKKAIGEFCRVFEKVLKLGKYNKSDRQFIFSDAGLLKVFGTLDFDDLRERYGWRNEQGEIVDPEFDVRVTIHIGYATKPDSLESSTFKGVWSDEPGQDDFKLESFEALQGRRARFGARHLLTTTPYNLGWLKLKLYDVWESAVKAGEKIWINVIRFESWMNPTFGRERFEKIRLSGLADWKFDLFYRAIFTRPAGAVYDIFDTKRNTCKRFRIPEHWPRIIGNDFGTVNMAAVKVAIDPATMDHPLGPMMYVYRTYHKGGVTTEEHVLAITGGEPYIPDAVGGNQTTEDGWRNDFAAQGLYIDRPTVGDVAAQMQAVYGKFKTGRLIIFNDLEKMIDEITKISYELDNLGEINEKKIKEEAKYHRHACLRYVISEWEHNPSFGRSVDVIETMPQATESDKPGVLGGFYS